jgi:LmbE family N-acetylglucosaminyl deacetylase
MPEHKTLMFIGAHPDDETFGPGAVLARYAAAGVRVWYLCATGGEAGTVDPHYLAGYESIADLRSAELACAAQALGLAGVRYLGYRDSGMAGAADNHHPRALTAAPLAGVAERIVAVLRELRPEVVVTHDPGGGYGHPDHVAVNRAVVMACAAAGDPRQFPAAGPAFQPSRLYFTVRPAGLMKLAVRLMPLFGQDPRRFGRNRDIDLTRIFNSAYPVHAVVRLDKGALRAQQQASACHASQGGGRPRRGPYRWLMLVGRLTGPREYFMRSYPPPAGRREKDLFAGLP